MLLQDLEVRLEDIQEVRSSMAGIDLIQFSQLVELFISKACGQGEEVVDVLVVSQPLFLGPILDVIFIIHIFLNPTQKDVCLELFDLILLEKLQDLSTLR